MVKLPKQVCYGFLASVLTFLMFTIFTALPWAFIYIEIGRYTGPYSGLALAILILIGISTCASIAIHKILIKIGRATKKTTILTNIIATLLIIFLLFSQFIMQVSQATQKIEAFIIQNKNQPFYEYVANTSNFLDNHIQKAYRKPEALFRIDNHIYSTLLGAALTQNFGTNRAAIIVYQGWGTCGQAATLLEELLYKAGYETRQAYFKNIDHQWAEVKYNGTWLIIDPWYIGNFVEARNLKNVRPQFKNATGVIVQYRNGTVIDASQEHGYFPEF